MNILLDSLKVIKEDKASYIKLLVTTVSLYKIPFENNIKNR